MNLINKRILVTGADGFIGSHLVEALSRENCNIKALSHYNSFNNFGWLEDIKFKSNIEILTGDIRDPFLCDRFTRNIDVIFHLAALIAIPYSYIAPESYVETNVKGTLNICHAALKNRCKKMIHTSTSEVYGTAKYTPIDEKHQLQPQSPYSASKIGADAVAISYCHSFGLPIVIARPFNTFGPRQSSRAVIPSIITQLASGKKFIKLGNVSPTRDFTYVEDTCQALIELAKSEKSIGQIVNIGTNNEISISELFNLIKELMSSSAKIVTEKKRIRPENSEVFRLCCDNSKIKSLTNFAPRYDLKKGLIKTIDWFVNPVNLSKYKTNIYNV